MYTTIEAIATGNPPVRKSQEEAAAFMKRVESISPSIRKRIDAIYRRSGIDYRHSGIADYDRLPDEFSFFPNNWQLEPPPTTHERNNKYREVVLPLIERVAGQALEKAGRAPEEITHLITVSCTGFFAPGPDIELVKRLNLPPTTARMMIGFMGCYAAFNALRAAHAFCQAHPKARVLVVCAELCTLHFQINDSLESAVVNALFSDGAAAAVLSAQTRKEAAGQWTYAKGHTLLDEDSMEDMTWEIGNHGFIMGLSPRVSKVLSQHLPGYIDTLVDAEKVLADEVDFWAIHPGGPRILEDVQETLNLQDEQVAQSWEVLRRHGNMSSPTILFVLKRCLEAMERSDGSSGRYGVALAFGPGLTIEGCLWQRL